MGRRAIAHACFDVFFESIPARARARRRALRASRPSGKAPALRTSAWPRLGKTRDAQRRVTARATSSTALLRQRLARPGEARSRSARRRRVWSPRPTLGGRRTFVADSSTGSTAPGTRNEREAHGPGMTIPTAASRWSRRRRAILCDCARARDAAPATRRVLYVFSSSSRSGGRRTLFAFFLALAREVSAAASARGASPGCLPRSSPRISAAITRASATETENRFEPRPDPRARLGDGCVQRVGWERPVRRRARRRRPRRAEAPPTRISNTWLPGTRRGSNVRPCRACPATYPPRRTATYPAQTARPAGAVRVFVRRDAFFYQRRRRVRARAAQSLQRREEVGDERPVDERALVMVRTVYVRGAVPERVKSVVRVESDAARSF